jgi:hypothetical protein
MTAQTLPTLQRALKGAIRAERAAHETYLAARDNAQRASDLYNTLGVQGVPQAADMRPIVASLTDDRDRAYDRWQDARDAITAAIAALDDLGL